MWESLLGPIVSLINKVIPDKSAAAAAVAQLKQMTTAGELEEERTQLLAVTSAQSDINKVEAASPNWFVAGARPFAMWICCAALAVNLIIGPIGTWLAALFGHPRPFPVLDSNLLMSLLFPLLGLGAYRTLEKVQGVAGNHS